MKRAWIVVFLFTLAVINYMDRIALSVAAQPIAVDFHLTPIDLGFLFSSFLWTYLICVLPIGALVDRVGPKKTNALGIALWSASTIATGLSTGYGFLVATRLAMGAGEASTFPAGARVIRQWIPANERGIVNAIFNNGAFAGPAFGSVVIAALVENFGWRTAFMVVGAVGFVWLALWLFFYNPPERTTWLGKDEKALILEKRDNATSAQQAPQAAAGFLDLLRCRSQWGVMLTQSSIVYSQYLFLTWLPGYLQQTRGITVMKAGLYTALPYAIAVILSIILGYVSDRTVLSDRFESGARRTMVVVALLISAVVLLTPFVSDIWLILGLITITLAGLSTAGAMNFALVNDLASDASFVGRSMSLVIVSGNIFGLLAPIVTGFVVGLLGSFDWAFVIAGALLILGAASALLLTRGPIDPTVHARPSHAIRV